MDYANRKRPPKRTPPKKSTRGKSQQSTKPAVPWLVVLLAVILVGGFAWLLSAISGRSQQPTPQSVDVPPAQQQPTAQPQKDPLPEQPEEPWDYIEVLENQEVVVDVPERELGPPKLMQCGSFRNKSDAEEMRAMIAMMGLESQIRTTDGGNGVWHRVILGPYESKRDAERDRHKLERGNLHGCQIWNWN
ncbi:SPOR domain-containing protein [Pseudidiomarina donghaiensis]|uniref:Cell division protein FtsN n=1 Tax=Pseudidiomarina donghaiensis TaxID=519452 RepID=A0A432XHZ4_9GAMM|nr:SPOR domain-containing protein [Pseudidiomarina donghaiensis]RUO48384.1 cell division protein FtsN [Pseudidiomarina donghaiensis]SFV24247.1 cell division protein FtsN [Pseudidiomarina donghaiensis]